MTQIPACYRNKLELWEDGKQNAHLPGDTQGAVEGMAASVAQETCKCCVGALAVAGEQKAKVF